MRRRAGELPVPAQGKAAGVMSEQDMRAVVETLKRVEAKLDEVTVSTRKVRDLRKGAQPPAHPGRSRFRIGC